MTSALSPSQALAGIPDDLRKPLLDEYNKVVRNFREGKWEPSELNGGKLAEVVYSILKGHVDGAFPAGPSKPSNMVDACRDLEKATAFPRSVRIQIPRVLLALYEIRNNRNVGHVGADVDPNQMDAALVLQMSKWTLAELVRIFHDVSTEEATEIVEALTERILPLVWVVGGRTRVLSTTLGAREKTLVVLYAAAGAVPVQDILKSIEYSNASRFRRTVLQGAHNEHLIDYDATNDTALLSPLGSRYIEDHVLPTTA